MESAASGIVAGLSAVRMLQGREPFVFSPGHDDRGADGVCQRSRRPGLSAHGCQFRNIAPLEEPVRDKRLRAEALARRALTAWTGTGLNRIYE